MPGARLRDLGGKSIDSSRATVRPNGHCPEHSRFTSSLALPSEIEGTPASICLHEEDSSLEGRLDLTTVEEQQEERRQELRHHLQQLKQDSSANQTSVGSTFGAAFYSLVNQYCQQRKLEFESVRGWIPITDSQTSSTPLATPSEDPQLQEGLRQILQLDERLMQKTAEAAMVARETFPDAWLAADRKQAEKDQKLLLASLDRERVRQARANKLAHALEALEPSNKENDPRLEERALYCMLQPEEEALVDRLLAQDNEVWSSNPFELQLEQDAGRLTDSQESVILSLADVDAKLEKFALASAGDRDRWVYMLAHSSPAQCLHIAIAARSNNLRARESHCMTRASSIFFGPIWSCRSPSLTRQTLVCVSSR